MGLFSFLTRKSPPDAGAVPVADAPSAETVRIRARRRLIGAAVLVAAAVVVLPTVFESKPRPLPVDIAIDIPKRDAAPPLLMPAPRASAEATTEAAAVPAATAAPASAAVRSAASQPLPKAEAPHAATTPLAPAAPRPAPAPKAAPQVPERVPVSEPRSKLEGVSKPMPKPVEPAKPTPAPSVAKPPARNEDGGRAQALLEGRDSKAAAAKPAEPATRFVVQVGAFEQPSAAQDARQRVEKLGLRTFVQEVTTAQGKRIRVRLGPFASRDEADRTLARLSAGGVQASVVPL
jgi:DedD protein